MTDENQEPTSEETAAADTGETSDGAAGALEETQGSPPETKMGPGRGGARPGSGRKAKHSQFEPVEVAAEHVGENAPSAEAEAMARDKAKREADEKAKREAATKKGSRKPPTSRLNNPDAADNASRAEAARLERCRNSGRQAADVLVLMLQSFMGPEWAYQSDVEVQGGTVVSERDQLREAYAETFAFYGWETKPDWTLMGGATLAFAMKRMSMPETQKRVQTIREKIVGWWMNRSAKKQQEKDARIRDLEEALARAEKA